MSIWKPNRSAERVDEDRTLVFGKCSGCWRLMVEQDSERVLLVSASRELRLLAVPLLPKLLEALRGSVDIERERVEVATTKARIFAEDLGLANEVK